MHSGHCVGPPPPRRFSAQRDGRRGEGATDQDLREFVVCAGRTGKGEMRHMVVIFGLGLGNLFGKLGINNPY
jgi:hypothetical protein